MSLPSSCSQQKAVISHRLDKKVSGSSIDARQAPEESIFRLQTFLERGGGLNSTPGRMNEILTFQHGEQAPAGKSSIAHTSPSSPFLLVDQANAGMLSCKTLCNDCL